MQPYSDRPLTTRGGPLVFAAMLAAAMCVQPPPAAAQWAVECGNCSTMWTQTLQYAKEAQSVLTQLQQYQTQLQQYANMVTNTVALPQEIWSAVQADIMRVQALSNVAPLLSGNSGSLITRLQNASAYANQVGSLANMGGQFSTYQQTIGNNLSTIGRQLGLQQGMESNNAALLASLQQHSQSAYVVDAALDRAALISGVGSDQQRVVITRGSNCR